MLYRRQARVWQNVKRAEVVGKIYTISFRMFFIISFLGFSRGETDNQKIKRNYFLQSPVNYILISIRTTMRLINHIKFDHFSHN